LAAKNATSSIPVVFLAGGDAVDGLVASLARPGANVTGVTFQAGSTLTPKLLERLKDLIPTISRVAVLRFPAEQARKEAEWSEAAARTLGISLRAIMLQHPDDLREAFAVLEKEKPQAVIAAPSGLLYVLRREIVEFTVKNRLPGVYGLRELAMEGGLMSFSPDLSVIAARGSYYVDRILRGARPADIPVEQPTRFELVINLKTAKALGLTIPPSLLQRADQVIE
jgi:putative ABC transport system substrate-binding protein